MAQSTFIPVDSAVVSAVELPAAVKSASLKLHPGEHCPYMYIISDKDLYEYFGYAITSGFVDFDFGKYHILGTRHCPQCLLVCDHAAGNINCHRNACRKEWFWVKRENAKAFMPVAAQMMPPQKVNRHDTIISLSTGSKEWVTTGHGDRFATFKYQLLHDRYYPVLLLQEWNYRGGCRAAGSKQAAVRFKEPAGIRYRNKRTILADKLKK